MNSLVQRFNSVKLSHLWEDNWCRILLFNGVERMISMRQGYSALSSKLFIPSNNNIELSKALSAEGGLRGWFKGSILNGLHFTGVFYPALYFSGGSFASFSLFYLLFDFIMMPLDRLRTLSYNTLGSVKEAFYHSQAYSGVFYKVAFNIPFLWALRTTVDEASTIERVLAWGSVALAYPLLSLKIQSQLNDQSIRSPFLPKLYAGLIPFLALNMFVHWSLKHLYSSATKNRLQEEHVKDCRKYDRQYLYGSAT